MLLNTISMVEASGRMDRLERLVESVIGRPGTISELSQLRAAALLDTVRPSDGTLPRFTFSNERLAQTAYLLRTAELERSAGDRRRDPGRLPRVAAAFEDLARRAPDRSPRQVELFTQAATLWSLAGFEANAVVLARHTSRLIGGDDAPSLLAALVLALLGRRVSAVKEQSRAVLAGLAALGASFLDSIDDEDPPDPADAVVIAALGLLAQAAVDAVAFWEQGSRPAADRCLGQLKRATDLVAQNAIVDTWFLLDSIRVVLEDAFANSLWRQLRGRAPAWNRLWRRHIRLLAGGNVPVVEAWPSQRRALAAGFLDPDQATMAVRMPTSAGKSHLAEFAILSALAENPGRYLAAFVVPSRSLAAEVEARLARSLGRVGLRVSALFGGLDHVDYELALLEASDVIVATAEKLDLLLRQDPTIADRLALTIVDEAHLVHDLSRGLPFEVLIARMRHRVPYARLILLSAVMPNVDEIGTWIQPGGGNVIDDSWSPSRLAIGAFHWHGRAVDGQTGTVRYWDHDSTTFVPYMLRRRLLTTKLYPRTKSETAAELALHYQRIGPILIGVATKPEAGGVAKAIRDALRRHERDGIPIALADPADQEYLNALATEIELFAGDGHDLAKYVRQGFAYHHADVPETVRQRIESAYRAGRLRILIATSTLSQGVNLPTKTVIIAHTTRHDGKQLLHIPVREFRNLAGRAGRAFTDTEGHVVVIADNEAEANALRSRYDRDAEPVQSVLYRLYRYLVRSRLPGIDFSDVTADTVLAPRPDDDEISQVGQLDTQLLALAAEEVVGTDDEAAIEAFLGLTLCAVQVERTGAPMRPFARYLNRRLNYINTIFTAEERRSAYRTGLSVKGCQTLLSSVDILLSTEPELLDPTNGAALEARLCELAMTCPEIIASCEQRKVPPAAIPALAIDWMRGTAHSGLLDRHGSELGLHDVMALSACIERVVARDLPWMLSALIEFLRLRVPEWEPPTALSALPAMAKFGVDSATACFAASAGIRTRPVAMALGAAATVAGADTFPMFLAWLSALAIEDIASIVPEGYVATVIERAAALSTGPETLRLLGTGTGTIASPLRGMNYGDRHFTAAGLTTGDPVVLIRDPTNAYDPNAIEVQTVDGYELGYIAREVARSLAPLMDEGAETDATLRRQPRSGRPDDYGLIIVVKAPNDE